MARCSPVLSMSSFTPVAVAICAVFQSSAVKVSGPDTVATPVSSLAGVTVTVAVGSEARRTV